MRRVTAPSASREPRGPSLANAESESLPRQNTHQRAPTGHLLIRATRPNGVATYCIELGSPPSTLEHVEDCYTTSSTPPRSQGSDETAPAVPTAAAYRTEFAHDCTDHRRNPRYLPPRRLTRSTNGRLISQKVAWSSLKNPRLAISFSKKPSPERVLILHHAQPSVREGLSQSRARCRAHCCALADYCVLSRTFHAHRRLPEPRLKLVGGLNGSRASKPLSPDAHHTNSIGNI